jgi:alpha-beta hydrolase superfamily lysophospholipase
LSLSRQGSADKTAKASGSQMFYAAAGSRDKTLKPYDAAFHDPLNDLDRETVMADIVAWLDARIATR